MNLGNRMNDGNLSLIYYAQKVYISFQRVILETSVTIDRHAV